MTNGADEPRPVESTRRATLLVLVSAACFATIPIFTTLATRQGLPLVQVLAGRYLMGALLLVPTIGGVGRLRLPASRIATLFVGGGTIQALLAFTSLSALAYIPAATMVFLFYTYPVWVAIFAAVRGTERVTTRSGVALALAFVGIAAIVGMPGSGTLHPIGAALALLGALIYALYIPLLGTLQHGLDSSIASIYVVGGAGTVFALAALATGQFATTFSPGAWGVLLGLGLLATAIPFATFLRGLRVLGPVRAAITSTIEPFCVAVLAALTLGQDITPAIVLGGVLIALAVLLLQLREPAGDPALHP